MIHRQACDDSTPNEGRMSKLTMSRDRLIGTGLPVALCLSVAFAAFTMWAAGQSRERTACLQRTQSLDACPKPTWPERALAWALVPETR